jgi:hypothetical protein|eukprot:24333-Pelagococcus_subviridis.AAC.2
MYHGSSPFAYSGFGLMRFTPAFLTEEDDGVFFFGGDVFLFLLGDVFVVDVFFAPNSAIVVFVVVVFVVVVADATRRGASARADGVLEERPTPTEEVVAACIVREGVGSRRATRRDRHAIKKISRLTTTTTRSSGIICPAQSVAARTSRC